MARKLEHHRISESAHNDMVIIDCIAGRLSGRVGVRAIAQTTGIAYDTVGSHLRGLRSAGVIRRVAFGIYEIKEL